MSHTRWIRFLLTLLPAALPLYVVRFSVGPLPTTAVEAYVVVIALVFIGTYQRAAWKHLWNALGPWRAPLVAWTVVTGVAALYAPDLWKGIGLWRAFVLEPLLVFGMMRAALEERDRSHLEDVACATAVGVATWGVIQYLTGWGIPAPWNVSMEAGRRATGPFPYPNALALFVVPIAAYAWQRLWHAAWMDGGMKRLVLIVTWIMGWVACLVAQSDGGFVALGAATVFVMLWYPMGRRLVVVGGVIGSLVLAIAPPLREKVWREVTLQGWSGTVRRYQWRETTDMLRDHWALGAGMGGYPTVFAPYHKATAIEIFQYPHNILLNVWVEAGIAGVLVMTWLLGKWGRDAGWRGMAPLVALLVHGLVDVPFFKNDLAMAWMILLLLTTRPTPR